MIAIYFTDKLLDKFAHELEINTMLSGDYVVAKFKTFAQDKFTRFTARAKYKIMMNIFKREFDIKAY